MDKVRRQIDALRMAIDNLSQYTAGLEHRMNSLIYVLNTQQPGANCAGAKTKQVFCPPPQDAGTGDLLHAHPSYADTDGSTVDAGLDLEQTLVTDETSSVDPDTHEVRPHSGAKAYLSNICYVKKLGDNFWLVLNDEVTFCKSDEEYGNLILKFAPDPEHPTVHRAYPVSVLAPSGYFGDPPETPPAA